MTDSEIVAAMKGTETSFYLLGVLRPLSEALEDGNGQAAARAAEHVSKSSSPTLTDSFLQCTAWYWNKLIPSVSRCLFMKNAPQGHGRLVTGGYNTEHIEYTVHAHNEKEKGRKVKPVGIGSDAFERDPNERTAGSQVDSAPDINYAGARTGEDYEGAAGAAIPELEEKAENAPAELEDAPAKEDPGDTDDY